MPLRTVRGFISINLGIVVAWVALYGLTGYIVGLKFGYAVPGAIVAALIGLYPAAILGLGAHYGGWLAYLVILFLPMLLNVPEAYKLWCGVAFCLTPWLLAVLSKS